MLLIADLGAGDAFGALQIHHVAVFLQIVKSAHPVRSDGEDVHTFLDDVINLLPLVFLHQDLVCQAGGAHALDALGHRLLNVQFATVIVVALAGNAHDQVVAQRLGIA